MTCNNSKALLEKYLDGETSQEDSRQFEEHIKNCPDCMSEYEDYSLLKETLSNQPIPPVKDEYWEETTDLILAKTVEANRPVDDNIISIKEEQIQKKSAFFKSLVSVAASLMILVISIMLGSQKDQSFSDITDEANPVYSIAPDAEQQKFYEMVDNNFQMRQLQGRAMLGVPGSAGKTALLYQLAKDQNESNTK